MIKVSIARVREATGIPNITSDRKKGEVSDEQIEFYNQIAHDVVASESGYTLEEVSVVEKYDGSATNAGELVLRHYPVSSLTYIKEDGVAKESDEYHLYKWSGKIKLDDDAKFEDDVQNIEVSYSYYDSEYIDIITGVIFYMVCVDVLVAAGNEKSEGLSRYEFDDYQVSYNGMPYGGQISYFQTKIAKMLKAMGHRAGVGVL